MRGSKDSLHQNNVKMYKTTICDFCLSAKTLSLYIKRKVHWFQLTSPELGSTDILFFQEAEPFTIVHIFGDNGDTNKLHFF